MNKAPKNNVNLETSLTELEKLINEMEKGGLPLEKSLENFEKGISLIRQSQEILKSAEQKVQILIKKDSQDLLQPYDDENEND